MVADIRDNAAPTSMIPMHEAETAVSAVASQAVAYVQARYAIAQKYPRDWDGVRVKLLKECKRPRFAAVALYNKPIGEGIIGPSIRFAEAAMRCMGNLQPSATIIYDDERKRILRVAVMDLENNLTYEKDVTITKTVERKKLPRNTVPLGTRLNSYGDTVYILPGTDDDILNKENALVSKALRTAGLRHLPGDILDEALDVIDATNRSDAAADPDAARKKLIDAFAGLNIEPAQLVAYLGHALGQTTPAEITELRALYQALRDGETTWQEVMDTKADNEPRETKSTRTAEKLKERREAKQQPAKAAEDDPAVAQQRAGIAVAETVEELQQVWAMATEQQRAALREAFDARMAEIGGGDAQA